MRFYQVKLSWKGSTRFAAALRRVRPRLSPKSSGGLKEVSLEKWGWKTIVSQFNCGGKSLVGSVLANFLDHAHNYDVVDEFTATSFLVSFSACALIPLQMAVLRKSFTQTTCLPDRLLACLTARELPKFS